MISYSNVPPDQNLEMDYVIAMSTKSWIYIKRANEQKLVAASDIKNRSKAICMKMHAGNWLRTKVSSWKIDLLTDICTESNT